MAIVFQCSQCGTSIRAPEAAAGKSTKCPNCQVETPVPEAAPSTTSRKARPAAPSRRSHPVALGIYAALGIAGLVLAVWLFGLWRKSGIESRFAEKAKEWGVLDLPAVEEPPYRRGPVAVIRAPLVVNNQVKGDGELDDLHFELSGSVRADDPAEVKTVILCRHGGATVGTYVDSSGRPVKAAVATSIGVTVFDLERGVRCGGHGIQGSPDAVLESSLESGIGEVDAGEIVSWIEALPAK